MTNLFLFCFAVVGLTNIIVDPATIARPIRDRVEKWANGDGKCRSFWAWLDKLMSCYQCTGFWVGMLCGAILISWNPLVVIFICGMGGSFIATWGASYLNYLEARSVMTGLEEDE